MDKLNMFILTCEKNIDHIKKINLLFCLEDSEKL